MNALGAIILAWRVKGILEALVMAQQANDLNFRILIDLFEGKPQPAPLTVGMNEQAETEQKKGIWLLVIGFGLIAVGNILVGASWFLEP